MSELEFDSVIAEIHRVLGHPPLSDIQLRVLQQTWEGYTYSEISAREGYEESYLRDIGAKLWKRFSDALGERVTKSNIRAAMSRYLTLNNSDVDQAFLSHEQFETLSSTFPEFPSGPVPLSSRFYVNRFPVEQRAYVEVTKPGALIRIRGPRKTGKNSLMLRILSYASLHRFRTVWLDLQQADEEVFENLDRFLRWVMTLMSRRLGLEPRLSEYWDNESGSKISSTLYLQEYLLKQSSAPLVLALNEVNRLFDYPHIAQEFFQLLRSWHEEAKQIEQFQKLRLVVVHSTDVYLNSSIHQSPFNVGLSIQLPEFILEQVLDLAQLHGLNWERDQAKHLMGLLGGHPYLIRLALYHLCQGDTTLEQLLSDAAMPNGIYGTHLNELFEALKRRPDLLSIVNQIIATNGNVQLDPLLVCKLERLGIVKRDGDRVVMRNQLYRIYLGARLLNMGECPAFMMSSSSPKFALGQRVQCPDDRFAYVVGLAVDPNAQSWEYCIVPIVDIDADDYDEMLWCSADELRVVEQM